jgi:MFS family permease
MTIDVTPLRVSRDYRLLYTGQFVSAFGSAMSYVVLPWQVYQLTKSTFAVGMLGVAEFVPMFVMAFVGGALADYIDRRRLVVLAEAMMAVLCGALVFNSLLSQPRVWALILMASLFAACNSVHRPAIEAMTPRIVPPELMPSVSALRAFSHSAPFIAGASLAGVVAAKLGPAAGYAFDASTYIASLVMLLLMRASVVSGGVMCVIGAGLLALFLPGFIRYDGREGLKRKEAEEAQRAASASAVQN